MSPYLPADFTPVDWTCDLTITHLYTGLCPNSGALLQLPRTLGIETIACTLMAELARDERHGREGKMYGVLLVQAKTGEIGILKAFSGLLNGVDTIAGWVPPIPGREGVAMAETETLQDLAAMKQELIRLAQLPEREEERRLAAAFGSRLAQQSIEHRQQKESRAQVRIQLLNTLTDPELTIALDRLAENSRQDGRDCRDLKKERDRVLQPLKEIIARADARMSELRQARKIRSRQLQIQMHDAYQLMNFLGTSSSLRALIPGGIPTGTGECCAPKLLHYAASHQFTPIAMAEFWWGANSGDKCQGEFYGACQERCQPLMGFMLAGIAPPTKFSLPIIYEDEYLMAIDKPAGLLSVPGRYLKTQDSVTTRLRQYLPNEKIYPVHRLDRDTSGILLLARDKSTHHHLSQQFQQREVHKVYEAILDGDLEREYGTIDLPLWGNPDHRPRQTVDKLQGKASLTKFQVIAKMGSYTRIEFIPLSGRTHQLRIHAADPQGLGVAILGDVLYGEGERGRGGDWGTGGLGDWGTLSTERLYLHARELTFIHPTLGKIHLQTKSPF